MTNGGYSVSGSWAYTGTDGILRTVVFTADQNGYRPRLSITLKVLLNAWRKI